MLICFLPFQLLEEVFDVHLKEIHRDKHHHEILGQQGRDLNRVPRKVGGNKWMWWIDGHDTAHEHADKRRQNPAIRRVASHLIWFSLDRK